MPTVHNNTVHTVENTIHWTQQYTSFRDVESSVPDPGEGPAVLGLVHGPGLPGGGDTAVDSLDTQVGKSPTTFLL
jgi:hypothetical protein